MTEQHRAKPEHWLILGRQSETLGCASSNAILELRARVEALEAAQREAPMTELRAASAEARPAGGLVERVEEAIITGMVDGDRHAARAAIREVAKWLDTKGQHGCSLWLREEADRG
jgi:hypothetical protein